MARAASVSVPVRAELDMDDLVDLGRRIVSSLEQVLGNISASIIATLDDARARSGLASLERPLDTIVTADPDTAAARGALGDLERPIDTTIFADPDTAAARGELGALEQPIDVPIVPHVDDAAAGRARDELGKLAGGGGGGGGVGALAGLVGGASAAVPGLAAAAGAAFGLKEAFDLTIGASARFEAVQNQIQAQLQLSDVEMRKLAKAADELGASTDLSTASSVDAAKAQLELAKGGLKLNDILGATKSALLLAEAGQIDQGKAAEYVATQLSVFGLAAEDAAQAADSLKGGADASSASVDDMAEALKYAGPAFAAAYKESQGAKEAFKQTAAAVAVLSANGQAGSIAGTSLAQALSQITNPGEKAGDAISTLNARLADQRDAKGYAEALGAARAETLNLAKSDAQDRIQKLNAALRSKDPGAFAQALAGVKEKAKEFDLLDLTRGISFDKAIQDTAGFEKQLGALSGAVDQSVGLFGLTAKQLNDLEKGAQNAAASKVLNGSIFVDAAGNIRPVFEQVKMLRPALAGLTDEAKLAKLDTIFGTQGGRAFLTLLNETDESIADISNNTNRLGQAQEAAKKNSEGLSGQWKVFMSQVETLGKQIGDKLIPVLTEIVTWMVQKLPVAVEGVSTYFEFLSTEVFPRVAEIAKAVGDAFEKLGLGADTLGKVLEKVWSAIRGAVEGASRFIIGTLETLIGILTLDLDRAMEGARQVVSGAWTAIKAIIGNAVSASITVLRNLGAAILEKINGAISDAADTVKDKVGEILDDLRELASKAISSVTSWTADVSKTIKEKFEDIAKKVGEAIGDVVEFIEKLPGRVASAITEFVGDMEDAGRDALEKMKNKVIEGITNVTTELGKLASKALSAVGDLTRTLLNKGRDLIDGLGDGLDLAWGAVRDALAGLGKRVLDAVGDVTKTLVDKGKDIVSGLKNGITGAFDLINEAAKGIPGEVIKGIGDVTSTLLQKGKDIVAGLIKGITGAFPDLDKILGDLVDKILAAWNKVKDIPIIGDIVDGVTGVVRTVTSSYQVNVRPVEAAGFDFTAASSSGRTIVVNNYSSPVYDDTRELTRVLSNLQFGMGA